MEALAKLLRPGGLGLVATKRYYFGCGGGTAALEAAVQGHAGLCCEVVLSHEDGKSNVRDVIEVRWEMDDDVEELLSCV